MNTIQFIINDTNEKYQRSNIVNITHQFGLCNVNSIVDTLLLSVCRNFFFFLVYVTVPNINCLSALHILYSTSIYNYLLSRTQKYTVNKLHTNSHPNQIYEYTNRIKEKYYFTSTCVYQWNDVLYHQRCGLFCVHDTFFSAKPYPTNT